ncbi:trem-like transcript 2 protein isoform X2 [Rhinolophus ferrumequinum]|uniref:trem-like transcript 2 protein isoform X2 n=1 Tax=Rhinolophus ferrumequinum TaxID=59479 RepID=UPI00140FED25|nr:trem-like transcript 2 protein isoform X2 [Rhinolophus ferrumequinum]
MERAGGSPGPSLADRSSQPCMGLRPSLGSSGCLGPLLACDRLQLHGAMGPTFLLLLLLLCGKGCLSGAPVESVYSKVQHFEGETLSVQCSYKSRKNRVEGKVWCKIRRKKCETGFARVWAQGPRYVLQDDTQAKVVNITMADLRRQDSGRYWCMRNSSGTLYPLMGFQLEVSPAPTTKRNTPLTQLSSILKSGMVVTAGQAPPAGPDAPFTTGVTVFTPGVLTLARLLPSTASGTISLASLTGYSFTSPSSPEPRRTTGLQTVSASPSNARASSAGPASVFTTAGHLPTRSPTTRLCHTSRSPLDKLPPIRYQDSYPIVLVGGLTFLSVPVVLIVVYGFWKKRHIGSYSVCRDSARPWKDPPGRSEPPWKPAWFKATYGVGELLPEGPQEARGGVKLGNYLDWSQGGG